MKEEKKYSLKVYHLRALLKKKDNSLFRRYEAIWNFALKNYLKFMNIDNFTDHGENHVLNIEKRIFTFLTEESKNKLSAFDIFCLLVSCCLHDIGMIAKKGSRESSSKARQDHHKRAKELLENKFLEFQLDTKEAEVIGVICYGHGIKDLEEIEGYDYWSIDPHGKVNVLFLTALLRLGDLLDLTFLRAPKLVADLKKFKGISLNHWKLHNKISDVKFDHKKHEITIYATAINEHELSELYKLRNWIRSEVNTVKANLNQNYIQLNNVSLRTSLDSKRVLSSVNPFIRLDSFDYRKHSAFFGRHKETTDLRNKILNNRLSILVGESGVGKTSLLHAGVKQKLLEDGYNVYTVRSSENFQSSLYKRLKKDYYPNYNKNDVFELLRKVSKDGYKIVIFYDQFEEIFTFNDKSLQQEIINFYKNVHNEKRITLKSVLCIRQEFLSRLWFLSHEVPEFYDKNYTYVLMKLSREQSRQAIINTLKHVEYSIENVLVEKLLDDFTIEAEAIYPPYLQIVCHKIFENHKSKYKENSMNIPISQTDYILLGRSQNIISEYFDEILDDFSFKEREVINEIVTQMITHFETKQRINKRKILKISNNRIDIDKTLSRLIDHRIIRKIESESNDEYEIIHDLLARRIIANKNIVTSSKMKKALDYIEKNYTKQIKLEMVAEQVDFTREHFCRLFKKETESNFVEYVNEKRIKDAKKILKNSSIKISEIYEKLGFTNQQHFTKVFKKFTHNLSPNAYRKAS